MYILQSQGEADQQVHSRQVAVTLGSSEFDTKREWDFFSPTMLGHLIFDIQRYTPADCKCMK